MIQGIGRDKLRKFDRRYLCTRNEAIKRQNISRLERRVRNPGKIGKRLDDMAQSIQYKPSDLNPFVGPRQLKGCFNASIEQKSRSGPFVLNGPDRRKCVVEKRICLCELPGMLVVSNSSTNSRHNREPPEIGFRIRQLMKRI